MEAIREFWGVEITLERLRDANLAREEWRLSYLAQTDGASGKERLRMAMQAHAGGAAEAAQDNPSRPGDDRRGRGVPVLLTGNLLNPEGIVSILDKAGAEVVWIDLCNGDRGFSSSTLAEGSDLSGFLAALAASYLQRHPCARMSDSGRRYQLLTQRAREAGARGVIYASLKFCDSYLYDFPRVQEMLRREGIPLLRLESDYSDGHVGQVLTRVEAFLEMI
jgi:benzoyl-CoA reductase/2-hydroxyglutaryl-CoA dehydratase subunit BcrC/BadD/HgdB